MSEYVTDASPSMPVYRSHKLVQALKISKVFDAEGDLLSLHFEDPRFDSVLYSTLGKPVPHPGWYLVKYADGYISASPAAALEEGHTICDPDADGINLSTYAPSQLENWFSYHAPTLSQLAQYRQIRSAACAFAEAIDRYVPHGREKEMAIFRVREAMMLANAGVACSRQVDFGLGVNEQNLSAQTSVADATGTSAVEDSIG